MNSRDKSTKLNRGSKGPTERGLIKTATQVSGSTKTSATSSMSSEKAANDKSSKHSVAKSAANRKDKVSSAIRHDRDKKPSSSNKKINIFEDADKNLRDLDSCSQEMATTNSHENKSPVGANKNASIEQETTLNYGNELQETDDDESNTLLESRKGSSASDDGPNLDSCSSSRPSPKKTGSMNSGCSAHEWDRHNEKSDSNSRRLDTEIMQPQRPSVNCLGSSSSILYHDDEEINQSSFVRRTSSDDDELLESGAALTLAEDSIATNNRNDTMNFVVYPMGCCEFDETELVSANNTRAIQKCILNLSNNPSREETMCWGLDQSQPLLMRLQENYIQFLDLENQFLYKSQPINTIKVWAVDDDNNFAFVIEERPNQHECQSDVGNYYDSVEYELLAGPNFVCYVFSSTEDDDMSCRVAAKLNDEINKYREQMANRMSRNAGLQQTHVPSNSPMINETRDEVAESDKDLAESAETEEMTLDVKYIGMVQVPRPVGIDVLNVAIDKSLAEASENQMHKLMLAASNISQDDHLSTSEEAYNSSLIQAKLHVSASSVIVENSATGEIIVECRIRYLTFMGISRRDIRWCGFMMQNTTTKSFEAHCFECYPTAGHVCDAIQASCSRMYEKMIKSQKQSIDDATSILPRSSKIRDTLAKTLSRIKLAPIIQ